MHERRYPDGEVRRILELATRPEASPPHPAALSDGLTLAEIQSIAVEVGVAPDAVARAAASLDVRPAARARRSWGMPIEVGRSTLLPRAPTDLEWELLVAELRATFGARGRVVVQGSFREWSNGNLYAAIEPVESGYRLRLGTLKTGAAGLNALGAAGLLAGAVVLGATALAGGVPDVVGPVIFAVSGAGAFVANLVRLPRWARERERQMAHIEATAAAIMQRSALGG